MLQNTGRNAIGELLCALARHLVFVLRKFVSCVSVIVAPSFTDVASIACVIESKIAIFHWLTHASRKSNPSDLLIASAKTVANFITVACRQMAVSEGHLNTLNDLRPHLLEFSVDFHCEPHVCPNAIFAAFISAKCAS